MKYEWLNNRQPLPAGHAKAGQIGAVVDFEDGRPDTQKVYAANEAEMNDKLLAMYGNTSARLTQVKAAQRSTPATPAAIPATPPAPTRMSADERMQTVADLNDPGRAGAALKKLLKEEGMDIDEESRTKAVNTEIERLRGETERFIQLNPDWMPYAGKANAQLLRDRTFARLNGRKATAEDFAQSFRELEADGVLQSVQNQQEPPAREEQEPSAPPATPPRGSTSVRPSTLQGTRPTVQGGARLTREAALALAGTDEYERRVKQEPGFLAEVERALATR